MEGFLAAEVRNKISNPINLNLFSGNFDDVFDLIDSDLEISNLNEVFRRILEGKSQIRNLGVDLPLSFGDITSTTIRTMVVAMDPKRNNKIENLKISVGSVFNLHSEEGRNTGKNSYWEFISYLNQAGFVYVTDIYKLYYEYKNEDGSWCESNKDKDFTGDKNPYHQNVAILKEEIKLIEPTRIITLGKEARNAVLRIFDDIQIDKEEIQCSHKGIEYIFLPHISTTVTQSIVTIGQLYKGLGIITKNSSLSEIGENLIANRNVGDILKF
jgi:hypothetical protein